MSFLAGWISNIIIFVLLATVIDMLLPNSSFQKYTKMVIGLLLIAMIITPILNLFQPDFEQFLSAATIQLKSMMKIAWKFNRIEEKRNTSCTKCIYFKTNG